MTQGSRLTFRGSPLQENPKQALFLARFPEVVTTSLNRRECERPHPARGHRAKAPALQRGFRIGVTLWRLTLSASQPHEFRFLRSLFCSTLPERSSFSVPLGPSRRNILMAAQRLR